MAELINLPEDAEEQIAARLWGTGNYPPHEAKKVMEVIRAWLVQPAARGGGEHVEPGERVRVTWCEGNGLSEPITDHVAFGMVQLSRPAGRDFVDVMLDGGRMLYGVHNWERVQ